MKLKVLSTGSSGNCYILTADNGRQLILDCGIKYEKIILDCDFEKVDGCIMTHKHKDHSLSKEDLEMIGVTVYCHSNLKPAEKVIIGNDWTILPIPMKHGKEQCFSYLIYNTSENKNIYFATDCEKLPKISDKVYDLLMVECNYDNDTVFDLKARHALKNSSYMNHLCLETLHEWFKQRTTIARNVLLIHGSNSGNLNYSKALDTIKPYGKNVQIAKPNVIVEF